MDEQKSPADSGIEEVYESAVVEEDVVVSADESGDDSASPSEIKVIQISQRRIYLIVLLFVIAGLLFYFKDLFVVALVNGEPISRIEVVRRLERQSGKSVLQSLISQTLVQQEARKQNISVTDEEIQSEYDELAANFEEQGTSIHQLLELQGMTEDELKSELKTQLLIEKLLADQVVVSDEEVDEYINKNKDLFQKDEDTESTEFREKVRDQLRNQKYSQVVPNWLQDLENQAMINYFKEY